MHTITRYKPFLVVVMALTLAFWANLAQAVVQHGNYCGIDNNQWGNPPISAIDAACRNHDLCYMRPGGMGACVCDRILIADAKNIIQHCQDVENPAFLPCGKGFAELVVAAFALKPCQNNQFIAPGGHDGWFWPLGQGLFSH
ncbi:MAG: hypothetical protein HQL07_19160 [Nitrospirae bacterium]|nr:hypothetical protein [Magnetococcales bacterium]HAT49273.1 hypothetical protein [Alphaproteobacteria bacterium]